MFTDDLVDLGGPKLRMYILDTTCSTIQVLNSQPDEWSLLSFNMKHSTRTFNFLHVGTFLAARHQSLLQGGAPHGQITNWAPRRQRNSRCQGSRRRIQILAPWIVTTYGCSKPSIFTHGHKELVNLKVDFIA